MRVGKPIGQRSTWPGYVSCGNHGDNGHGALAVDVDCARCVRMPKAKTAAQYLAALRRMYGLEPVVEHVAYGEQLALEGVTG